MESPSVPSEHPVVVEATVITAEVPPGLVPEPKADAAPLTVLPGYVPIKSEFLRPTPARVSLDKEGRSSGMNVGSQRADCTAGAAMTQRPTFDGERNFLTGDFIQRAKPIQKGRDAITKAFDRFNSRLTNAGQKEQPAGERREREEPATEGTDATVAAAAAHTAVSSPATVIGPELMVPLRRGPKDDECPIARRKRLFENKLVLAPLTTVGNLPFRRICKDFGVDVTVGEMAVGYNLNNLQKSEWSLLRRHESEDIFGLQIATGKGVDAALTAQLLEESAFDYDFIDINCGCPIDLMVSRGCGCGLWEKKNRMRDVVRAFTNFQSRPVTVKVRIGADETNPRLHTVIGEYEGWGASAVTIHGRSRKQRYSRLANWDYIQSCSSLTQLPVIGNGDLLCTEDYVLRKETCPGVTSLMVGRGALLKPWLFTEFKEGRVWDISASERFDVLKKFCSYGLSHLGADEKGVATTRRFLLEWLSFYCRYVPVALLERMPQRMNDRPPFYAGRDDLETLLASDSVTDWVRISEMLLGPVKDDFKFTPKHKSNSYTVAATSANDGEDQG